MKRRKAGSVLDWGNGALRDADLSNIMHGLPIILSDIGQESVDVYLFLTDEFARGSAADNFLFQFVYRSYYRLDGVGLTRAFKKRYFELMENERQTTEVDIRSVAEALFEITDGTGRRKLQFSFVTKLAGTVDPGCAIYDVNIGRYFRFRPPYSYRDDSFAARVQPFLDFYADLGDCYRRILADGVLENALRSFRSTYSARVPDVKILDFIFWSAGRLGLSVGVPGTAQGTDPAAEEVLTGRR